MSVLGDDPNGNAMVPGVVDGCSAARFHLGRVWQSRLPAAPCIWRSQRLKMAPLFHGGS